MTAVETLLPAFVALPLFAGFACVAVALCTVLLVSVPERFPSPEQGE